jgi:TolB-like protein/Tfp pilus assembly protein PilF
MEKDKGKRYQSAGELRSELINIEKGIPTTERVVPERKPITSREITVTFGLKKLFIPAVVVVALIIAAVVIWRLILQKEAASPAPGKPSIAVLPFADLSPQKDQEHFCEGFAESLINALAKIKDLRVPGRTSSFSFKGKEQAIEEIGKELDVKTVLEGSVQKAGNKIRITVKLINVADESLLWSEQYNREMNDIFSIQDEITMAIVDNLKVKLLGKEKVELIKRYTDNLDAYNFYLQGRYHWNKRSGEGMLKSIEYFKKAIEVDSTYASAYAGLADSYIVLGEWGVFSSMEVFPKAKDAALRALEIDDGLAEAHNALAMIKRDYDWDWKAAEREFKKAIELNPNYPTAHQWYAEYLSTMGRHDQAIAEIKRAQDLDPLSLIIKAIGGVVFLQSRQFDQGIEQCQKVLDLKPSFTMAHVYLGWIYLAKGMYEEAIAEFQKALDLSEGFLLISQPQLGYAYALSGKRDKAQKILDQLDERSKQSYVRPSAFASVYQGLGENDRVFELLEKGYEEKDVWLVFLKVNPQCDSLRSDPRFKALLKKMNLE